jgi:GntR family transcriptional repressor for pyruvate dehydrogenase complex
MRVSSEAEPTGPSNNLFHPVASVRMSTSIVDQIRARIRSGELQVGTRLPAERELCTQFGVSRLTIREALRMLEANGLVTIKLGKEGGAFVSAPTASLVGQGMTDLITTAALSSTDMTEVRTIVESGFLPLICERATDADIQALLAMCDRDERARRSGTYTVEMSFEFHLSLAACAHNPAASLILEAFRGPIVRSLADAHHLGTSGVAEHRSIVAAIARRDVDAAAAVMTEHLARTARAISS